MSSARVDAHLATTEAAAGDALNAAETAAETAGDGAVGVVMAEARRHLADLEPKGAVEALLAVTAFDKSRGDHGNVATLLKEAGHRLRDLAPKRTQILSGGGISHGTTEAPGPCPWWCPRH